MKKIILLLVILFSISHISNGQTEIVVLKDSFEIKKFAKELSEKRNVDISIFRFKGKFDSDESPIGDWVVYSDYAMSKKAYEGNYKKGKKDGKWTLYAIF